MAAPNQDNISKHSLESGLSSGQCYKGKLYMQFLNCSLEGQVRALPLPLSLPGGPKVAQVVQASLVCVKRTISQEVQNNKILFMSLN